ncbi:unnamed protein product [Peronospora farinosa]|uniref:Glycosyl transferase family 1 domain-containing protein n=1 Tax=Peronospora farinosa TaxID=134698 RepID=A0AAV0T818_9STRA|nr:unnamed protein product [Peronospora farinosa]CAI5715144.1 unnamed protein product [Peronospora farinosa]
MKPIPFLSLLFGILVAFIFCTLVFELSLLTSDTSVDGIPNFQRLLNAAAAPGAGDTASVADMLTFYPDEVYDIDWSQKIHESDLLHEAALHRACVKYQESIISYEVGRAEQDEAQYIVNETDPQLLEKLKQCPDVDVFIPSGLRDFGYCEDAAAYTKFLKARMLPRWVLNSKFQDNSRKRTVTYHELCPNTPMIFFNHYWDGVPDALDWPTDKPLYLMPNMEMFEISSEHFWRADVVLCKTALCARYVRLWFKQEGNPKGTRVLYTRHITSNLPLTVKNQFTESESQVRSEKNFSHVSILHTPGNSGWKGTRQVLECWLSRPDLPLLELYTTHKSFPGKYAKRIATSKNVILHNERLDPAVFGRLITDATYVMCSSVMEGYGHYINQARASRALIFTTDVAPMNELITSQSGVLIKAKEKSYKRQFLGGDSSAAHALHDVPGFVADFNDTAVCDAVTDMLNNTTIEEREMRADKALQQYYFDVVFFVQKMQELRKFARAQSHTGWFRAPRWHDDGVEYFVDMLAK